MRLSTVGAFTLAAIMVASAAADPALAADSRHPTIVEQFQSQGCSSCPPANANIIALSDRPDLLTLSLGVTYWDHLGWKDTFASPQFTRRQWDYAHAFRRSEVFTPQVVVNGRADVVGTNRSELEALIAREQRKSEEPTIEFGNDTVQLGAADRDVDADVWLVRYDPNVVQVPIEAGENEGRTLPHKNVVKQLVNLGQWSGKPAAYRIPGAGRPGLRSAILVQDGPGGAIVAALRLD